MDTIQTAITLSSKGGFSQNIASHRRHSVKKQERDAFNSSLSELRERITQLGSASEDEDDALSDGTDECDEEDEEALNSTQFSRRVLVPTNQRLNEKKICLVNKAYSAEEEALNTAHDGLLRIYEREDDDSEQDQVSRLDVVGRFRAAHRTMLR